MTNQDSVKKTIVIAGINSDIGREFATRLQEVGKLYGISRKEESVEGINYEHIRCNLLNEDDIRGAFIKMNFTTDLTYVHLPGKFQFQDENHPIVDRDKDGVADDIFATNVQTFRNIKPFLVEYLKMNSIARLKLVAMGSAADLYDIPYWHSFTHSKNELRKEFRLVYGNPETYGRVGSLFINVSTTDGKQLAGERPFISKRFVLTPKEILDKSLEYILDNRPDSSEICVLKPNPNFMNPNFLAQSEIKKRWYEEMYGTSSR